MTLSLLPLASGSPFPFLEQVGDRILKAGQQVFAIERAAGTEQAALRGGVTDFDEFPVRVDDPGEPAAAGEVITQPLVHLAARVGRRKNFDCKIRGALKKPGLAAFQSAQAFFANERDVR